MMDCTGVFDYSTGTINTVDGGSLFYRRWDPKTGAVATVFIVHGLGEHSGRYVHVGRSFAEAGFQAIAFDLRGHGRSDGKPVFIRRYEELASDVYCIFKHFTRSPAFLFGHSLGAQLVLWTVHHFQLELKGLIASAVWLALAHAPPRWQVMVAKGLNRRIPGLRFPTGIGGEKLSHDQMHLDSLEDLDLVHRFITIRMYLEAVKAAREILGARVFKFPILMVHGDEDEVTSCEAAENYFDGLQTPSKTFRVYPGFRHELHNETDRTTVLADYVQWMRSISTC
jgi:alpha-beta hydrolase superfamily lysophospholipase